MTRTSLTLLFAALLLVATPSSTMAKKGSAIATILEGVSGDDASMEAATTTLAGLGPEAVASLIDALQTAQGAKARVVIGALVAMGSTGLSGAAVTTMITLLQKQLQANGAMDQPLALDLVDALAASKRAMSVPVLVQAMGAPSLRPAAMTALASLGEPAVPSLVLAIKSGTKEAASTAVEVLLSMDQVSGSALAALLEHPKPAIRSIGLAVLSAVGDASAPPAIAKAVAEEPSILPLAIQAMTPFYEVGGKAFIIDTLSNEVPLHRAMAIRGILEAGDTEAFPVVEDVAETDKDVSVRLAGLRALWFMGHPHIEAFCLKLLQYEEEPVRLEALEALGFVGTMKALPVITDVMGTVTGDVDDAIVETVAAITAKPGLTKKKAIADYYTRWKKHHVTKLPGKTGTAGLVEYRTVGKGPHVVVIPGGFAGTYDYLVPPLAPLADDMTLVFYDPRGHGTSGTRDDMVDHDLDDDVADLELLRTSAKLGTVTLLAHGEGVFIAIAYAAAHPDAVAAVILADPPGPWYGALAGVATQKKKKAQLLAPAAVDFVERFGPLMTHEASASLMASQTLKASFYDPSTWSELYGYVTWPAKEEAIAADYEGVDLRDALAALPIEVLVIHGTADVIPPDQLAYFGNLATTKDGLTVKTMDKAGHFPFVEQPKAFRKLVKGFLYDD